MVEMKRMELSEGKHVLGMQIYLPHLNLYLIVTPNAILCDESFQLAYLETRYPDCMILQVPKARQLEDLLEGELVGFSHAAGKYGVTCQMKGKDGLEKLP